MTRAQLTSTVEQNTGGAVAPFVAGKNKIINGDFGVWQRGTSGFPFGGAFNADRWQAYFDSGSATYAITQQPLPASSIVGVDSPYCWQMNQSVAGSGGTVNVLYTKIENVQTFAGQTATLSFYAKSDATRTALAPTVTQSFGTGGSADVTPTVTAVTGNPTNLTISWQRFVYNVTVPSISGKTIGTGSYLLINIRFPINTTQVNQLVGVQLEAGSVATPFTTATGTLQGELAACQRYLPAISLVDNLIGYSFSTTSSIFTYKLPVTARVAPTGVTVNNLAGMTLYNGNLGSNGVPTALTFNTGGVNVAVVNTTTTAGSPTLTAGQGCILALGGGSVLFTGCEL
jgi:hypothetical protein